GQQTRGEADFESAVDIAATEPREESGLRKRVEDGECGRDRRIGTLAEAGTAEQNGERSSFEEFTNLGVTTFTREELGDRRVHGAWGGADRRLGESGERRGSGRDFDDARISTGDGVTEPQEEHGKLF